MQVRGVRGATQISQNTAEAISEASAELLCAMVKENGISPEDIAVVHFSTTPDITADFPPYAARSKMGWHQVPLMSAREMEVPGALERCIRILILWNTEKKQSEIRHVYLHGARRLRPDLDEGADID